MKNEHKPRPHDHLVEPVYGALREGERTSAGAGASDWRWKIVWAIVAVIAIGYVVWRQAF
jgi:hypothetical protein